MYPQTLCIPHTFEAVWFLKIQNFESSSKVAEVKGNWGRVKIFEIFMIHAAGAFKRTSSHVFSIKTRGERLKSILMIFPYFSMRFGSSTLIDRSGFTNPKNTWNPTFSINFDAKWTDVLPWITWLFSHFFQNKRNSGQNVRSFLHIFLLRLSSF